ncbi:putative flavoprotein involved in K+ transport [Burkholderia sp. CF099]|nr:putative flavoprotein involved in K+ transport [Burkholderia sp. CF099]
MEEFKTNRSIADSVQIATVWLAKLESLVNAKDVTSIAEIFQEDCHWRDLLALTWNIKTVDGQDDIAKMLLSTLEHAAPRSFSLSTQVSDGDGYIDAWFEFETVTARCLGNVKLVAGKAWTVATMTRELKGFEATVGARRPIGAEHGIDPARTSWKEKREIQQQELGSSAQPYVLIIGGSQGGLTLAARLKQLGVPTLIVEKNANPGDTWRLRYKTLCLHDPVWYNHLPYSPFPESWPVFSPKDKLAGFLDSYADHLELDFWGNTVATSAHFDETLDEWRVSLIRAGEEVVLRPKQLVLATGNAGMPNMPNYPGMDLFKGVQQHSSEHAGPDGWSGRKAVVIGSNNSAHDICAALWEGGAEVTMVQRSSTLVIKSSTLAETSLKPLYSEKAVKNGISTDKADLIFAALPFRVLAETSKSTVKEVREKDSDFYQRLEAAGFMLDFGEDDSGLFMKYLRRASGYYIDVGASELIADGRVSLRSGVSVELIQERSVLLSDGSELPADLIVYATGYKSMNTILAQLISQDVANKVGKVWGYGSGTARDPGPWEGELRNMWKPTAQKGLWFHGGNLYQARHYSSYLALQLKARMEGIETPVYGMEQVHHKA